MDLTGQVALITGASRGLGLAFAEALLAAGARVSLTARSAESLAGALAHLPHAPGQLLALPADVADPAGAEQVVAATEAQLGPITLLINNAAQFRALGAIGAVDPGLWWQELEVNLRGTFLYAHAVVPRMRARRSGRVLNLASAAGLGAGTLASAYCISKTAVIRLSETLARETAADGLVVFAIHPGTVRTPMTAYLHDAADVADRAAPVQRWFQKLFASGKDEPIELAVALVMQLAQGKADSLSGWYLSVEDDLDALVQQHQAAPRAHQRTLRLLE